MSPRTPAWRSATGIGVATVLALLAACSSEPASTPPSSPTLPALPTLAFEEMGEEARERLEAVHGASTRAPDDPETVGRLGMLLHAYQQYGSAEPCYERAHLLAPREFRWAYYLGTVRFFLGKDIEAATALRQALQLNPTYVPAQLALGDVLLAAGELDASREVYASVIAVQPELALAHHGLGRVQSAQADPQGAIEHYRQASELSESFGNVHYALALAYRDVGDSERSEAHLALYDRYRGVEQPLDDPLLADVQLLRASDAVRQFKVGLGHLGAGRAEPAIAAFESALEQDPTLVEARVNLISLYGRGGEVDKAVIHYRAALAIAPDHLNLHYNYGILMRSVERLDAAAEALERVVVLDPSHAGAHVNLGLVREQQDRIESAMAHYRMSLEHDPSTRLAHLQLGWILLSRGQSGDAAEHFQRLSSPVDAQTASFLFRAALAYGGTGQMPQAIDYALRARTQAETQGQTDLVAAIDDAFGGSPDR